MTNTAPIPGPVPDVAPVQLQPAAAPEPSTQGTTPQGKPTDLRLVIEDDKAAGSYVYITVNPVTGEIVSQIPREQLLKMRENPDYHPGSIIDRST